MATWADCACGNTCSDWNHVGNCRIHCTRTTCARTKCNDCWHWPGNGNLIRCTDNNKVYKYIDSEKKLYLLYDQNLINENNQFWGGNGGNSNCTDSIWGSQTNEANRGTIPPVTTAGEGTAVKCYENNLGSVYRWTYGKLMGYPNPDVANSWDSNWGNANIYSCASNPQAGSMTPKPNDGDIIKCTDSGDSYYRYNRNTNQLTYYPRLTDAIIRQYNSNTGPTIWNPSMFQVKDCQEYNPSKPEVTHQSLNTDTTDGTPLICYKQNNNAVFRYKRDNDSILHYPNPQVASTWDNNWSNYKLYDCSRIWDRNSGVNYNLITSKPSDGTIVKCSDDGKLYRYSENNNKLFFYETTAIAKQYSNYQLIQDGEINIATSRMNFAVNPDYDANKLPTYTFYFECCIEQTSGGWRNIMNHGVFNYPPHDHGRRPGIFITGNDTPPANRIHIVHSTDYDWNANMISNFVATPGQWFTCCFIVNRSTMFTYFNGNRDATISNGSNFNWGSRNKNDWFWNVDGPRRDGFIKVRNVRFWPFVMALEWPQTFNPVEITDEINPYSLKPTGNKVATTTLPPSTNCKAYSNDRGTFTPTQPITSTTIKDGDTFKCANNLSKYRYNQERNKIFKYPDDNIAKSWDPNYNNYKAYECGSFLNSAGTMEMKPNNNDVIKCTENCNSTDIHCLRNANSYRFVNDTNHLEWYMNDNIIKQYNPDWLITDRLTRNCTQFKIDRPTFVPTQKVSPDTTSLYDGTPLKCDNQAPIYRYNQRYDILMEYPNEVIGNSWDPTSFNGYYSYTCDKKYIDSKGRMDERPKQDTVIKCDGVRDVSQKDNKFYYTYIYDDNSLKPRPSIASIQKAFPDWNVNNIKLNDCRQYYIREPRFYNNANGTGVENKIQPENYEGCNVLPYTPTDVLNRSLIRDGENVVLYTDTSCNNIYKNIDGESNRGKSVNITYTTTNAFENILNESNPTNYKILSDDEYKTLYAIR